jgi:hypothetical protein
MGGLVFLFVLSRLVLLRDGQGRGAEKQEQERCAADSESFHGDCLRYE